MVLAEENLASFNHNPRERMVQRSDLYLSLEKRRTVDWLARNLLPPPPGSSPRAFARQVDETVLTLRATQGTTARNMVADAVNCPDPFRALAWLKGRHQHSPLLQQEIRAALERLRRSKTHVRAPKDTARLALEEMRADGGKASPSPEAEHPSSATPGTRGTAEQKGEPASEAPAPSPAAVARRLRRPGSAVWHLWAGGAFVTLALLVAWWWLRRGP